ncbi:hypothetical protein [Nostoc sp.]|uniref:hypothetical protein n=1 Tax=Nostoc sp. TaxID=1180 RepID=UPI002FFAF74B
MLNKKLKYLVQATLVTVFGLSTLALISNTPAQAASLEITDFTSFNDPDSINGIASPYGINNHGEIVGNYQDANGYGNGFTAEVKAVPEPGTIAATFVFGVGLITTRLKLRRKQKASQAA